MSRLDNFDEILNDAEARENAKSAPKKLWRHDYETIDSKAEIATPSKIKGRFVYEDEKNTVKVSYIGSYVTGAPELSKVDDIQVQLCSKKTPESIESLVTLKSDETYRKERLQTYVSELHIIKEEIQDEKNEFAIFRGAFIIGLNEVIRKIIDDLYDEKISLAKDKLKGILKDYTVGPGVRPIRPIRKGILAPKKTIEDLIKDDYDFEKNLSKIEKLYDLKNIIIKKDIKDKIENIYLDEYKEFEKFLKENKYTDKPDAEAEDEDSDDGKDKKNN